MSKLSELVVGKYYVLDQFSTDGKPVSGPFDTREQAEADRVQLNIDGDCYVAQCRGPKVEGGAE